MDNDMTSLKELITLVRSATTALTSVPKPFKFLKTHYQELTTHYKGKADCPEKVIPVPFSSIMQISYLSSP